MLLAFDDTDGPAGGCTTHLAFHVLLALPELALTGMPRLVRLNPNVPWKTRGNGAVVLPLGVPRGPQVRVGELRGQEVLAFPEAGPADPTPELLERAWAVVQKQAQPGAHPAVALLAEPPPAAVYWEAVRAFVDPAGMQQAASDLGALHRSAGDGRALVGCLAAAAWPGPAASHEVIAYREPRRWGKPREVDPRPLLGLDATGATFHTYDAEALRPCCVPHTPDPVLVGLRGRDPERLLDAALRALPAACKEPIDGWLLWASNQASGDHVTAVGSLAEAPLMGTVAVAVEVVGAPQTRQGGHVAVACKDAEGADVAAVAFEPTKSFRDKVRGLAVGDDVLLVGAFDAGTVRLEKMEVLRLAPRVRMDNPRCKCGRVMRSKGPSTGFKCPACGEFKPRSAAVAVAEKPQVAPGWHEVPVIARRHLHRPAGWG